MFELFKKNTDEDEEILKKVFNSNHDIKNYVLNYTVESFYYKYLNKFLREENFESFRILSNHISKFIYHLYEYKKTNFQQNNLTLFRNMYLSQEDFDIYLNSIGKVICYPSFTSTSVEQNGFMPFNSNINEQLIRLIINQNNSKSVVSISKLSNSPSEQEYLFLPFSFFKIINVVKGHGDQFNPHLIYLMAIDSEKPIEDMFIDFMENETDNLDPEGLDMLLLINNDTKIILNPRLLSKNNFI